MDSRFSYHKIVKAQKHHKDQHGGCQTNVEYKLDKVLHVLPSNTVIDPWTVMIHLKDALSTFTAVMCPLRLPVHVALPAIFHPFR